MYGEWISVNDRLPEINECVLAWEKQGFAYTDVFKGDIPGKGIIWAVGTFNGAIVTHWIPLPEPPKEEKEDA